MSMPTVLNACTVCIPCLNAPQDHIRDMKGFGFTSGAAEKAEDVRSMLHKAEQRAV